MSRMIHPWGRCSHTHLFITEIYEIDMAMKMVGVEGWGIGEVTDSLNNDEMCAKERETV